MKYYYINLETATERREQLENEFTNNTKKYDVIFDTVGKLSYCKAKKNLKSKGSFLTPVLTFSTLLKMLLVSPFSKKKLKFDATGMRKKELIMQDLKIIRDLMAINKLTTVIDKVYTLDYIQKAHSYVDKGKKRGNVVITMES